MDVDQAEHLVLPPQPQPAAAADGIHLVAALPGEREALPRRIALEGAPAPLSRLSVAPDELAGSIDQIHDLLLVCHSDVRRVAT